MSDNTYDNLKQTARRAAHLYAALLTDKPFVELYNRTEHGVDIPASTRVVVTVALEYLPDKEVTPELDMMEFVLQPA